MNEPVAFLNAVAQSLAALSMYPENHPSRERAVDGVYQRLRDLLDRMPSVEFSFLGDEVILGDRPLREMRDWDWSRRLAEVGLQRLQFDGSVTRSELEDFLDLVLARLTLHAVDSAAARPERPSAIKYGAVGIRGDAVLNNEEPVMATVALNLRDEADAVRWMHGEMRDGATLPLAEAEAVVRGLSVAMHGDQHIFLPLLELREFDQYTTTHSLNVSTLTMGLAEWLGMGARDVRAFGVAGLMHDLGKVKVPPEILNKAGKLNQQERAAIQRHTVEGARLILAAEPDLELAAVVAYEHHIMIDGGGYPTLTYARACHQASKLVHVCDVYDALRTDRPYRDAWPAEKVMAYITARAGVEFDGEIAHAFVGMMQEWEPRVALVGEDQALPV